MNLLIYKGNNIQTDLAYYDIDHGSSLVFGDVPYPPVSVGGIIFGLGPPELELGDTLGMQDLIADIDPGPGESFQRSGSVLVRPVILDDCVPV